MESDQENQEKCPFFDDTIKCQATETTGWDPGEDSIVKLCRDKFRDCGGFIHSDKKPQGQKG